MKTKSFVAKISLIVAMSFALQAQSGEMEGHKFDDKIQLAESELVLNGLGLRQVERFKVMWDVYVGALYLTEKQTDASAIINSDKPKRIVMSFIRSLSRNQLLEAYEKGFYENCVMECDKKRDLYKAMKKYVHPMKKGERTIIDFYKDKVVFSSSQSADKRGELVGEAYVKNIMAIYIGKKPPSKRLRSGLLGGK